MTKFLLIFTYRIILENWRRMFLLATSITLFISAYRIELVTDFFPVESIFQDGGTYYYQLYNGSTEKFDSEQTLYPDKMNESNLCLKRQVIGPETIACLVVGVIVLIAFIVIAVMEDWDADDVTKEILRENYETEVIDGVHYHYAFGRLIDEGPKEILIRWILPAEFMRKPRFKSTMQIREDKLNKIGV